MPSDSKFSLVDFGSLSKPADTLIKKVSSAVGVIFEPYQIKRVAQANVEAEVIEAEGQIKVTEIQKRAIRRLIEEETRNQKNIDEITYRAIPDLNENAQPENMDNDWLVNFFDKSKIVSNSQMKILWARILAGEANSPGSYSARTVASVSNLNKNEAELFTKLCRFNWKIERLVPLIFDEKDAIYERNGINFDTLNHLDSIGLIKYTGASTVEYSFSSPNLLIDYHGKLLSLTHKPGHEPGSETNLDVGGVMLTQIGQELASISGSTLIPGFWEYVKEKWKEYLEI